VSAFEPKWEEWAPKVQEIVGDRWKVDLSGPGNTGGFQAAQRNGLCITLAHPYNMYEESGLTFDQLVKISEVCGGTKNINFKHDSGWGGTDVTPGDPSELEITVRAPVDLDV
jgi:hypothetical protein